MSLLNIFIQNIKYIYLQNFYSKLLNFLHLYTHTYTKYIFLILYFIIFIMHLKNLQKF